MKRLLTTLALTLALAATTFADGVIDQPIVKTPPPPCSVTVEPPAPCPQSGQTESTPQDTEETDETEDKGGLQVIINYLLRLLF